MIAYEVLHFNYIRTAHDELICPSSKDYNSNMNTEVLNERKIITLVSA